MSRRYEEWLSLAYGEWHTYLKGKIQTLEDSILQLDEGDPNSHIVAAHLGSEAYFWEKIAEEIQPLGSRIPGFTKPRISPTSFPTGTTNPIPQTWELTKDVELHRWQKEASEAFLSPDVGNGKGVVQAVTGSGKTILALHIIERLYRQEKEQGHSLGVIIVVPTIVMMNQWYDELISGQTNLDSSVVAKLGDSQQSVLGETTRIIIAVVNSISRLCADPVRLRNILRKGPVFLIADEVHRYGSPVHRNIFTQTARPWNYILGISATPERDGFLDPDIEAEDNSGADIDFYDPEEEADDSDNEGYIPNIIEHLVGKTIYRYNFADAGNDSIIADFRIHHYGLIPSCLYDYEQYSKKSVEVTDRLRPYIRRSGLHNTAKQIIREPDHPEFKAAKLFLALTIARRRILYRDPYRQEFTATLFQDEADRLGSNFKAILFHESIDESMLLWHHLVKQGHRTVCHNSALTYSRDLAIEMFRAGIANSIFSAKTLIEGVNIPDASVGIITAATSSTRQRIQSLGRLLRRQSGISNTIHAIYYRDTVETTIYRNFDWEKELPAGVNLYYHADRNSVGNFSVNPVPDPPAQFIPVEIDYKEDPSPCSSGLYPPKAGAT